MRHLSVCFFLSILSACSGGSDDSTTALPACTEGSVSPDSVPCLCGADEVIDVLDTAGGWCCDPAVGAVWDDDLDCSN